MKDLGFALFKRFSNQKTDVYECLSNFSVNNLQFAKFVDILVWFREPRAVNTDL
jgi:hypothetical protein